MKKNETAKTQTDDSLGNPEGKSKMATINK
jgi:hypothetical protein